MRRWILAAALFFGGGCGKKKAAREVGDDAAAAVVDASLVGTPPELTGTPLGVGLPLDCAQVFPDAQSLNEAAGAPVVVKRSQVHGGPPQCELVVGAGQLAVVMVDCTVRGGQADKALEALREDQSYLALAEVGKDALATPGQVVFIDTDTDCLVTMTSLDVSADSLVKLARLAERGVSPRTVW